MAPRPFDPPPLSPTTSADPSRASSTSSDGSARSGAQYVPFDDIIVRIDTPPSPPAADEPVADVPVLELAPGGFARSPLPRGGVRRFGPARPARGPDARRREIDNAAAGRPPAAPVAGRRRFVPVLSTPSLEQSVSPTPATPPPNDGRRFAAAPSAPNLEKAAPWSPTPPSALSPGRRRFVPVPSARSLAEPKSPASPSDRHFAPSLSASNHEHSARWPKSPSACRGSDGTPSPASPARRRLAPVASTPALSTPLSTPPSPPSDGGGARRFAPVASVPALSVPPETDSPCRTEDLSTRFNTRFSMHSCDSFDIPGAIRVTTPPHPPSLHIAEQRAKFVANAGIVEEYATRPLESDAAETAAEAAANALADASHALRGAVQERLDAQRALLRATGKRRTSLVPGRLARLRERSAAADAAADAAQREFSSAAEANGSAASRAAGLRTQRDKFWAARKAQYEALEAAFGPGGLPEEPELAHQRDRALATAKSARAHHYDASDVLDKLVGAERQLCMAHFLLGGGGHRAGFDEGLHAVVARGLSARFRVALGQIDRARLYWRDALVKNPGLPLRRRKTEERELLNSFVEIRAAVKEMRAVEARFVETHAERVGAAVEALQGSLHAQGGVVDIAAAEVKAAEAKADELANLLFERRREVLFKE